MIYCILYFEPLKDYPHHLAFIFITILNFTKLKINLIRTHKSIDFFMMRFKLVQDDLISFSFILRFQLTFQFHFIFL